MTTIGITIGDPCGIGPEVIIKALADASCFAGCRFVIFGSYAALERAEKQLGIFLGAPSVTHVNDHLTKRIVILDDNTLSILPPVGAWTSDTGRASYHWIRQSIDCACNGSIDAVVTGPISKEALHAAAIDFPGHTEIFAHFTDSHSYAMMFMLENVCVTHVTTHCSLRDAIALIDTKRVSDNIYLLDKALRALGHTAPRIAVGGLNPHAGENGLFGTEEIVYIIPAITEAQQSGINVTGPYPPDTVFHKAFHGEFDGVVAMLHDHGFVALKSRDFEHGVNITVGLPIIRTSVGHGTGFDIAGKGVASEKSCVCAIEAAAKMAETKKKSGALPPK